jgi:hypothetical protein
MRKYYDVRFLQDQSARSGANSKIWNLAGVAENVAFAGTRSY